MAITRSGLADEIDGFDLQIKALNEAKSAAYKAYREQLEDAGMEPRRASAEPNTKPSSRRSGQKSSLRALWKSILIFTGRKLIACGGRLSALGAMLIFKAERDE